MSPIRLLLVAALCLPTAASAAVWGGFTTARVNYSGGVIATGNNHDDFRTRIAAAGDTIASPTSTLTDAYLDTVDVFYTSLAVNSNPTLLTSAEQTALLDFVTGGGVLIITADIFGENFYTSVGSPFGITNFTDPSGSATVSVSTTHPLGAGVSQIVGTTYANWTPGPNGQVLATHANGNFLDVYDGSTGFTLAGAVLVVGDHNIFTDSFLSQQDNQQLLDNIIAWAGNGGSTNDDPVAEAGGPYSGTKNNAIAVDGSASTDSDGTIVSYDWDCDTDGTNDVTGATASCSYPAVGSYTLTLTVTDDAGATATDTAAVTVGNDAPIAVAGGPYPADEAVAITLDASSSTDAGGAIVLYEWDCTTDGTVDQSGTSPTVSCTYPEDGTFTATLTVTDDDGATATDTASVEVANVAPVIGSISVPSGSEGVGLAFSGSATDVVLDPITYTWDFGDGSATATGSSVNHTYADDGTYTVTLTATDDEGGSSSMTGSAVITNAAPTFTSITTPAAVDEGASYAYTGVVADIGTGDIPDLVITWDWGDGTSTSTGNPGLHTYADDGTYTIIATVDDQDGGTASQTTTVTVGNVQPGITSSPPTAALEGTTYTYTPNVVDPGAETFIWTLSPSASSNTQFDTSTGVITWTPDSADAIQGSFALVLTVFDGDGGSDAQSWTVNVTALDSDSDGMPDYWENANGLNPNNAVDAGADPDADGITNLDEFLGGTDPQSYDGPSAPVAVSPLGGAEVADLRPFLVVDNATDPQGDVLTYTYEVYSDAALTTLVASTSTAPEGTSQTEWELDIALAENTEYWWRAAASDAHVTGPWTTEESFFVNATEEAPTVPVLTYPIDDETAASLTPTLQWAESTDPDGDAITYDLEVYDEGGALVTSTAGVVGNGTTAEWTVDVALAEDAWYDWTVRAVDDTQAESAWAAQEGFFVSESNGAPSDSLFLDPLDGQSVASLSPELVATESVDPEGTDVTYTFEVDTAVTFDSPNAASTTVSGTGSGSVSWDLEAAGIELVENTLNYAQVRAVDEDGISSTPDLISFFVRGVNEAPGVPELVAPTDGEQGGATPDLTVNDPSDPEGDVVSIEFLVATDEGMTEVVASSSPVITGAGTTSWTVDVSLEGRVYWTARSMDTEGAMSDWATPWVYTVEPPPGDDDDSAGDDDDDDDDGPDAGCDCSSSVAGSGSAGWLLVLLLPLIRRRR